MVHEAGQALGFQVLMISHHDVSIFERYADRIYEFVPDGKGAVEVRRYESGPGEADGATASVLGGDHP